MEIYPNVTSIDFKKLIDMGIDLFVFDFDNTVNKWKESKIPNEIIQIFNYLEKNGAKIIIVSNGKPRNLNANVKTLWLARKPMPFKFKKYLKEKNIKYNKAVVIGDQLFTDMLFGKLLNAYLIKVEPLDTQKEFFITKILRFFEKIVLKFF
ncbi:had-superfamily phosphatase subfamily iiia [Thermosipho africanus H17ap60334]|jgi:HAD superfamily phosphatase (TIGR01668 family)|uniref:YqeG family HAD IIIA-type phosphatase n=1 Tax=Thermosipho africanus TaxID=2421 RepID=UPI00028E2E71|nr:HAD-IIIA family hydrolase [Thermosipho africanus]EKF49281.1 had-superfamily phosphatase subfamily iiia [Thermosipho africanus H17ap60334]MDK2839036.1 putative phosphatase [Thermosipho sp. (in: thermotogales)]